MKYFHKAEGSLVIFPKYMSIFSTKFIFVDSKLDITWSTKGLYITVRYKLYAINYVPRSNSCGENIYYYI